MSETKKRLQCWCQWAHWHWSNPQRDGHEAHHYPSSQHHGITPGLPDKLLSSVFVSFFKLLYAQYMTHLQDIHARQQSELRHSQFFCSDASPSTCGSTGGSGSNVWLCWAGSCAECLLKGLREKKGRTILLLFQKGKLRARGRLHELISPL